MGFHRRPANAQQQKDDRIISISPHIHHDHQPKTNSKFFWFLLLRRVIGQRMLAKNQTL
jgi:hypothetical protein